MLSPYRSGRLALPTGGRGVGNLAPLPRKTKASGAAGTAQDGTAIARMEQLEDRPMPGNLFQNRRESAGQLVPMKPAAMSHRLVADQQLVQIAQMATVGGHRDVLLRDRPTTPGRGFDLQDSVRGRTDRTDRTKQTADALALLHQPVATGVCRDDAPPMFPTPAARGASYSIPHHHQAHHSNVTAVDGVPHKLQDEPLLDCLADGETCLLFYFCPCVLVARTARFAGFDPWLCGCMWCMLPPCVGAVLRQSVALRLAEEPPHFLKSLIYNHCVCCVCSVLQEARVAKQAVRPAGA